MKKIFDELSISLATSDQMRSWSFGEVKKPETINYRTLKPEKDGLFDERIFGPTKDWECSCGRYKRIRYRGIVCERCGVEVTRREVRRERMGHIELAAPVTHIWYFKGVPSRLGYFLDMSPKELEKVIYFAAYLVVSIDEKKRTKDLAELEEAVEAEVEIVIEDFEEWEQKRLKEFDTEIKAMENAKIPEPEIQLRKKDFEKEIKQKKAKSDAEITIIEEAFTTLKTLKPKTLVENDVLWREMIDKYDGYFTGGMGAEAVRDLVLSIDLNSEIQKLESDLDSKSAQRRQRAIQRMKVIKPFAEGKNPPEAMVLEVIPVIPPELRPMVQLDGGRFATSDLNDLYRRLINRNNRLKKLIELGAPEIIISNEKRMLQESVDALFDNGRRGRAVAGAGGRGLKSLSDMLKGKQGRFRQNLLGKRVDYSARSVIVVGPHLELQQCGLPKMMALELFKPFVMKRLVELGLAQNIKSAKRMVERSRAQVWDVLAEVIEEHPVLLNRAPTLHRLGIQAFEPILVEGKAIQVHPLVCEAFNADFDGDQMAVHVPLSAEAQAEARVLMLATNNVLSPASGNPIVSPSQDMVIGLYYITECFEELDSAKFNFVDFNEAQLAYEADHIGLNTPINVKVGDLAGDPNLHKEIISRFHELLKANPVDGTKLIQTTLGRMHFNSTLPKDFPYIDATITKSEMKKIISEVISRYNKAEVRLFLDNMKSVGFKYGTKHGLTIGYKDILIPELKDEMIESAKEDAKKIKNRQFQDIITKKESLDQTLELWNITTDKIQKELTKAMEREQFNPVDMMVKSGARGNMLQVRQLGGMRGLVADPNGQMIEIPITSNFREGMTVLEYFTSTHGARKGLADTALRTADSGYLTRRLVDVAAGIVIKDLGDENIDWKGTKKNIIHLSNKNHLHSTIYGRVLAEDIKIKNKIFELENGDKLVKGIFINEEVVDAIHNYNAEKQSEGNLLEAEGKIKESKEKFEEKIAQVYVLTPFNSLNPDSMDPLCYGYSLATGQPVEVGEAVGIISAQSIGEPGTQLTMRTFHTGGSVQTVEVKKIDIESGTTVNLSSTDRYEVVKIIKQNMDIDTEQWKYKKAENIIMYCLRSTPESTLSHGNFIKTFNPNIDNDKEIQTKLDELKKENPELKEALKGYEKKYNEVENVWLASKEGLPPTELETYESYIEEINEIDKKINEITEEINSFKKEKSLQSTKTRKQNEIKELTVEKKGIVKKLKDDYPEVYQNETEKNNINLLKENAVANVSKNEGELKEYNEYLKYFSSESFNNSKLYKIVESGHNIQKNGLKADWVPLFDSRYNFKVQEEERKKNRNKKQQEKITAQFTIPPGSNTFFERVRTDLKGKAETRIVREQVSLTAAAGQTTGLPRIVEIFEARTPKGKAVLAPIAGKINAIDSTPEGNRLLRIVGDKEEIDIPIFRRQTLLVSQGDTVDAGQSLTVGPKDPKEVLQINGVRRCQEYLVEQVQFTYRDQGVVVHDKHVEMIVRQMLRRVRIVKSNNSDFLPNELVDATLFRKTNQELVKDGKVPAEGRPELMGITKASLATDSWLSAASFQETTRVLTEAAMKRSKDSLSGLKENVIIGTLIPAGTGSEAYQSYTPSLPDAPEVSELGFMTSTTEESEEDALPNPAQWLAMLGEEKEEENE